MGTLQWLYNFVEEVQVEVLSAIILTLALLELKYVLYVGYAPSYKDPLKQCSVLLGFTQFCYVNVHSSSGGLSA